MKFIVQQCLIDKHGLKLEVSKKMQSLDGTSPASGCDETQPPST
jgi:hypothetical protein